MSNMIDWIVTWSRMISHILYSKDSFGRIVEQGTCPNLQRKRGIMLLKETSKMGCAEVGWVGPALSVPIPYSVANPATFRQIASL